MTSMTQTTLTPGRRYDVATLTLLGWTEGDGSGHEGYRLWAYFDADGGYLGPDAHGIEPIVVAAEDVDDEPETRTCAQCGKQGNVAEDQTDVPADDELVLDSRGLVKANEYVCGACLAAAE